MAKEQLHPHPSEYVEACPRPRVLEYEAIDARVYDLLKRVLEQNNRIVEANSKLLEALGAVPVLFVKEKDK